MKQANEEIEEETQQTIKKYIEESGFDIDFTIEENAKEEEYTKYELKENPLLLAKYYSRFFQIFQKIYSDSGKFQELYEKNKPIFVTIYKLNMGINTSSLSVPGLTEQLRRFVLKNYEVIDEFFEIFWEVVKE